MNSTELKQLFIQQGALLEGHFQLTSGRHSPMYLQCALILQNPTISEKLGEAIVANIKEENAGIPVRIDAVVSPAIGGIVLGHVVARAFGARAIFAERENGSGPLRLRRGFSLRPGENVVAVEDVITTGGSLKEVVQLALDAGTKVLGVASVAERSSVPVHFGVTKTVLMSLPLQDYLPENCPMCKEGMHLSKPGSRNSQSIPAH